MPRFTIGMLTVFTPRPPACTALSKWRRRDFTRYTTAAELERGAERKKMATERGRHRRETEIFCAGTSRGFGIRQLGKRRLRGCGIGE
eukprot:scaffold7116_cov296-Pinguiococcus_pyrenoidosus.AAC.16